MIISANKQTWENNGLINNMISIRKDKYHFSNNTLRKEKLTTNK